MYVPLNFSLLSPCDLSQAFEGFILPCSARLNQTCFMLSNVSAFQQTAPSGVYRPPISFSAWLTLVIRSLSQVPPLPGSLLDLAGWFRCLSWVLLQHLGESIENILFHLASVSSRRLSIPWRERPSQDPQSLVSTGLWVTNCLWTKWAMNEYKTWNSSRYGQNR